MESGLEHKLICILFRHMPIVSLKRSFNSIDTKNRHSGKENNSDKRSDPRNQRMGSKDPYNRGNHKTD